MSRRRPKPPRKLRPGYRVPRLIHDQVLRQGKREGYGEALRLSFWRRVGVALRIVRGETREQRAARRLVEAARDDATYGEGTSPPTS